MSYANVPIVVYLSRLAFIYFIGGLQYNRRGVYLHLSVLLRERTPGLLRERTPGLVREAPGGSGRLREAPGGSGRLGEAP